MLIRFSYRGVMLLSCVGLGFSMLGAMHVLAQGWQGGDGPPNGGQPVYQQHAFDGNRRDDWRDRRDYRRDSRYASPQVSAGSFQRPYPYHLDYYKMRYGGSYAPYFGNLYGTPQVVNYPPYYGPYYTGYGGGNVNGAGQPGYGGGPPQYPPNPGIVTPGTGVDESAAGQTQTGEPPVKAGGETLPVPKP